MTSLQKFVNPSSAIGESFPRSSPVFPSVNPMLRFRQNPEAFFMSDNFHRVHAFTAHWEGGFSDHPADTGGLTAYGASLKFVQGIAATQQGRDWLQRIGFRLPVNKASMRSVTPDMAEAMFKREFWDRLRLDDMPFRLACALYDAAVNSGCAQSVRLAQRGYNACVGPYGVKIEVDGILGPRTRASLACDTDALIRAVIQARRAFYEGLARDKPSQAVFLEGWLNRADSLEKFLLAQRRA